MVVSRAPTFVVGARDQYLYMKKKLAIFDIDGTIFRNSLLIELHWKLIKDGVFPKSDLAKIDSYYWAWVNREGSYQEYLDKVIESFDKGIKGKRVDVIRSAAREVVERQNKIVYRFTRDLIKKIRKEYFLLAISGSPIETVEEFNRFWKFDAITGTTHEERFGRYTGKKILVPSADKKGVIIDFLQTHPNISTTGSIGIGDTESDIGIFDMVQRPICFNPTKKLFEVAKRKKWPIVVERKNVVYKIQ